MKRKVSTEEKKRVWEEGVARKKVNRRAIDHATVLVPIAIVAAILMWLAATDGRYFFSP